MEIDYINNPIAIYRDKYILAINKVADKKNVNHI